MIIPIILWITNFFNEEKVISSLLPSSKTSTSSAVLLPISPSITKSPSIPNTSSKRLFRHYSRTKRLPQSDRKNTTNDAVTIRFSKYNNNNTNNNNNNNNNTKIIINNEYSTIISPPLKSTQIIYWYSSSSSELSFSTCINKTTNKKNKEKKIVFKLIMRISIKMIL